MAFDLDRRESADRQPPRDRARRAVATGDLGRYPWVAMGVVLTGTYLLVLNLTVLGVALPEITEYFRSSARIGADWVVTAYVMAIALSQPLSAWGADRYGRKNAYVAALALFTVGSALAAAAPSLELLVAARVVQGFGGGVMMPVGMAMVYELFPPHRRGTALGIYGVAIMAAPALGPPLGGWVVTAASWRWVFIAYLPIAALALVLATRLLRQIGFRESRPFDTRGWALISAGIVTIVLASRQAGDWGIGSPATIGALGAGVVLFGAFVASALRTRDPIIEVRMFQVSTFRLTILVVWLITFAQFARLTFLPVELQVVRGFSAQEVGMILAPGALGVAVTMPIGGWIADRVGPRLPVSSGMAVIAATMWFLANLKASTSVRAIVAVLVVQGLGTGLALMPNTVAAMNSLPNRFVAQASAVRALNRQLAGAVGTAVLAAVVVAQLGAVSPSGVNTAADLAQAQSTYNKVFLLAFASLVAGFAVSLLLPGKQQALADQAARAKEHEELFGSETA